MAVQSSFVNRVARVKSKEPVQAPVETSASPNIKLPIIAGGILILAAASGLAFTLAMNAPEESAEEVKPAAPRVIRLNG